MDYAQVFELFTFHCKHHLRNGVSNVFYNEDSCCYECNVGFTHLWAECTQENCPLIKKLKEEAEDSTSNAVLSHGDFRCKCGKRVYTDFKHCPYCGKLLNFIDCSHEGELYSRHYIDYDRNCYEIYCNQCNTQIADLSYFEYERYKKTHNIVKEL